MIKKWMITALVLAAGAALVLAVHLWAKGFLEIFVHKGKPVAAVKMMVELLLIPAAVIFQIMRLWRRDNEKAERPVFELPLYESALSSDIPALALHRLPAPPADFTGREGELRELTAALEPEGGGICGLCGMGGIGKTALALKLAESCASWYPDARLFLDLRGASESPLCAAEALAHVLHTFQAEARLPAGEVELMALYRSTLQGKRVLLVLDDAREPAQVVPLLPPAGSALILTSRKYLELPGLRAKDLGLLPPADSAAFLLALCPRINGHAGSLAKLCGYMPLALRSVGSNLAKRFDITPTEYAQRLAAWREKFEPVEATLRLSYELLDLASRRRFEILSIFPETFDAQAAAAVWDLDPDTASTALGELVGGGVLEWDQDTKRYHLHELVRRFSQYALKPQYHDHASRRHAQYYLEVLRAADAKYEQGGQAFEMGLALFDTEGVNIHAGQSWAAEHASKDREAARLCNEYPDAGLYCLELRQNRRERIEWLEAGLAVAQRWKDREAEGAHLGTLGLAYMALGEVRRATIYHEKALAVDRETGNRRGEEQDLINLGKAYATLGEHRRAIECEEQRLAITREVGNRMGESQALENLGSLYTVLGQHSTAVVNYQEALAIDREIGDRRGEGRALVSISFGFHLLGDREQAIAQATAALNIYEQMNDPGAEIVRQQLADWASGS